MCGGLNGKCPPYLKLVGRSFQDVMESLRGSMPLGVGFLNLQLHLTSVVTLCFPYSAEDVCDLTFCSLLLCLLHHYELFL